MLPRYTGSLGGPALPADKMDILYMGIRSRMCMRIPMCRHGGPARLRRMAILILFAFLSPSLSLCSSHSPFKPRSLVSENRPSPHQHHTARVPMGSLHARPWPRRPRPLVLLSTARMGPVLTNVVRWVFWRGPRDVVAGERANEGASVEGTWGASGSLCNRSQN